MTTFGRTTRQDTIWVEFNDIRNTVDAGLLSPEDGNYEGEDLEDLQAEWESLIDEYVAIHVANETRG